MQQQNKINWSLPLIIINNIKNAFVNFSFLAFRVSVLLSYRSYKSLNFCYCDNLNEERNVFIPLLRKWSWSSGRIFHVSEDICLNLNFSACSIVPLGSFWVLAPAFLNVYPMFECVCVNEALQILSEMSFILSYNNADQRAGNLKAKSTEGSKCLWCS